MLISKMQTMEDLDMVWDSEDECEELADHAELRERLRKTLYFGRPPSLDHTSLPMTELAVEYFQETIPRELGRVDMYWASSFTRRASVSPCAMMLGMLYIERLRHKNPDYLKKMSSEELFLISMMVASKYLYDEGVTEEVYNDEWAAAAPHLALDDINALEVDFLSAIDWSLFVDESAFTEMLLSTERCIAMKEAYRRGYLTYTDLCVLTTNAKVMAGSWHLLTEICKMVAVCSFAYTMGVCTMAASTLTVTSLQHALITATQQSAPALLPNTPSEIENDLSLASQLENDLSLASQLEKDLSLPEIASSAPVAVSCADNSLLCGNNTDPQTPDDPTPDDPTPDDPTPRPLASTVTRFLTLALVKDTLMAFVFGRQLPENCSACDDPVDVPRDTPCQCPNCPKRASRPVRAPPRHPPTIPYPRGASDNVCHPSLWVPSHCAASCVAAGTDDGDHSCGYKPSDRCRSVWDNLAGTLGSASSGLQPALVY